MKKVLIITYYWPPSGGAGVQRWLKFVKYLRHFGWEPVVLIPEDAEYPSIDESLLKDVPENLETIKVKFWEPYSAYKWLTGKKGKRVQAGFIQEEKPKSSFKEKLSVWLRGNFFIPDARMFWIGPSVKVLSKYLKENKIDAIVSTGPPHSAHMIALKIKKRFNLPWIADFRDPWTNIDFYKDLMLTRCADRRHRKMEKQVLETADAVTTVSWHWADEFKELGAKNVKVITNGFDPEDFKSINEQPHDRKEFVICHMGAINKDRNHPVFWETMKRLSEENHRIKIRFIGKVDFSVKHDAAKYELEDVMEIIDQVAHDKAIRLASQSDVLYLPLNNTPNILGVIPGKIFEYLALKKPVLCIGNTSGDSARILSEFEGMGVFNFDEHDKIYQWLKTNLERKEQGGDFKIDDKKVSQYARNELTKQLVSVLNSLVINEM